MNKTRCITGDCIEVMRSMDESSVDAIVTDPPYGLGFMGKAWDGLPPGPEFAGQALRVLKPGGHLLAFGGTRTFHRLVVALEDAGFEIRDTIAWLYGSGFPKSRNLDGEWRGWGTALKPAHEPIVVARRPLAGTVAANVLEHGTGALNVDGCRIGVTDAAYARNHSGDRGHAGTRDKDGEGATNLHTGGGSASAEGRWPANVVLDEEAAAMLDEQTGVQKSGVAVQRNRDGGVHNAVYGAYAKPAAEDVGYGDSGGASRFFYCAKASRKERNAGLDGFEARQPVYNGASDRPAGRAPGSVEAKFSTSASANHHPTVKPVALMRWLVRMVTPPGGVVLDPFLGSGTTGVAAALERVDFVGIEREDEYAEIARARIAFFSEED